MTAPMYLDTKAAAKALSISPDTLKRAVAAGELPARKRTDAPNSKWLFAPEDLRAWVEGWRSA